MNFIYLTSKTYPGTTADHAFVWQMAVALRKLLGANFRLTGFGDRGELGSGFYKQRWPFKKGRLFFYIFWLPWFYLKIKRKEKDIYFFSNDAYLLAVLITWRKVFGFKYEIVSDWHQLFKDWRDNYVAQNSDYLITTTEYLKNKIVEKFRVNSKKIFTAYGGVDLDLFNSVSDDKDYLRKELGLTKDKKLIGYVGGFKTMGMDKGVGDIIKSLQFLADNFMAVLVGGKKEEQEEYKKQAKNFRVLDKCIFVDRQEGIDLIKYEKAMDVLVIPYPDREHFREWGFPMKTYEYMASGVSIICSDLPILSEVLNGLAVYFEPGNYFDLAERIKNLGNFDGNKAHSMVGKYTWEKRAGSIIDFIVK